VGVLRFRLFGFPVAVQPGFWILALIIGAGARRSAAEVAILIGVIVVSVLAHELGHAATARFYGQEPRITLHMLGGLTSWALSRPQGRTASILITLAGPGAGFALATVAFAALMIIPGDTRPELVMALNALLAVNVFWSAVNLLPVLPFDGGQIMAAALGPARRKLSATLSLVFGLVAAVVFWRAGLLLGAAFFAMGALQSFFAAREGSRPEIPPEALRELLARARIALDAGDHAQAGALARAALEASSDAESARSAIEIGTWAALLSGDIPAARAALRAIPAELAPDPLLRASVLEADGDLPGAVSTLLEARHGGDERPQISAALVRVLLAQSRLDEAVRLTLEIFDDIADEEIRQVADEALRGGALESAGRLYARLGQRSGDPTDAERAASATARAAGA
jgi:Zn-dependent protease